VSGGLVGPADAGGLELDAFGDARRHAGIVGLFEEAVEVREVAGERQCSVPARHDPDRGARGGVADEVGWRTAGGGAGDRDAAADTRRSHEIGRVECGEDVGGFAKGIGEFGEEGGDAQGVDVEAGDHRGVRRESNGEIGVDGRLRLTAARSCGREQAEEGPPHVLMIAASGAGGLILLKGASHPSSVGRAADS
jgi:hypothetical protein